MEFIADLHIHSRFSRATAKNLDFPNLYMAARIKGITLVATGDFTHPAWMAEISEHLVPAEPGLFKLRDDLEAACDARLPFAAPAPVRFILETEISNIYKKAGATRKNHNLVFLPDLDTARKFNARLDRIGNIKSDGRPILGLDARDLLEIVLETSTDGFLIPAHIWTPWFSLFGSKSGFDRMEDCFEDLTPHIFALETGLSSDPPMNWRVGDIDGRTLVSNSDAHSPANLGREANIFRADLSYFVVRDALRRGDSEKFLGTIEFFPQEGKYHHDGHRNCGVNRTPEESLKTNDLCPVCGRPMTLGVLHRVMELATRPDGGKPEKIHPFVSVIPLAEIIAEIVGTGPKSKKVTALYDGTIKLLGPELPILYRLPAEKLKTAPVPFLAEAVTRMRAGRVDIIPGFDGEYGKIRVLSEAERDRLSGQKSLFQMPEARKTAPKASRTPRKKPTSSPAGREKSASAAPIPPETGDPILSGLNPEQQEAVTREPGPLLIVAGPGTGKTRTLTCRIAHLIGQRNVLPEHILAITFTRKAADEMAQRLSAMLGETAVLPVTATFHAFCFQLLKEIRPDRGSAIIDDLDRTALAAEALERVKTYVPDLSLTVDGAVDAIVRAKQHLLTPADDLSAVAPPGNPDDFAAVYELYQHLLDVQHLYDYEDLILETVRFLESDPRARDHYRRRYPHLFVDEYQDLNLGQYRVIRALAPDDGDICVIGDPDQSIYGFRGSDVTFFRKFTEDFPGAAVVRLNRNYRSTETILSAAFQVIRKHTLNDFPRALTSGITGDAAIHVIAAESEKAEAVAVGKTIEAMVGGMGFAFDDFRKNAEALHGTYRAFSDFAVLYRTRAQGEIFADILEAAGIPCYTVAKGNVFGQKGILELLSLLKIIEGRGGFVDFTRVNAVIEHGITAEDMEALKTWALHRRYPLQGMMAEAGRLPVSGLTSAGRLRLDVMLKFIAGFARHAASLSVADKLIYLSRQARISSRLKADPKVRDAFDQVLHLAAGFGDDAEGFLENAALLRDPDVAEPKSQRVSLMTIHAAKGLEFPVVFVAGCEDGLMPFSRNGGEDGDPEEERRLFYVAMTRAKEILFLTRAKKRTLYGKTDFRGGSPFLSDIDPGLLKTEAAHFVPKARKPVQLTLF